MQVRFRVLFLAAAVVITCTTARAQLANSVTITSTKQPVLGFLDISANGTPIQGVMDDSAHVISVQTNALKNAFFTDNGVFLISNNGVVVMGLASGGVPPDNQVIPPTGLPVAPTAGGQIYLFPFWDDLLQNETNTPSNTTIYWQLSFGVLIIMWKNETHFSIHDDNKTITFEIQIFDSDAFPDCDRQVQFLYPDTFFGPGETALNDGASATIGVAGNQGNAQFSFNSGLLGTLGPNKCLTVTTSNPGRLVFTSPFGPGSLQVFFGGHCAPDFRYLAVTLHQGTFPNGWLFGVDMPFNEIGQQLSIGAPFTGPGGSFLLGPVAGLPPVTLYAVVIAVDNGVLLGGSNAVQFSLF